MFIVKSLSCNLTTMLRSRSHGGGNFCPMLGGYVANPEV